jgi:hypothetical protein
MGAKAWIAHSRLASGAASRALIEHGLIDGRLPYKYESLCGGKDFFGWLSVNRGHVEQQIRLCGAVLFRGFGLADPHVFAQLVRVICRQVITGFADLPPGRNGERFDTLTPYPATRSIPFHNDSCLASWPTRQLFACVSAAAIGGETPLVDCRRLWRRLDGKLREQFVAKGLLYLRHFVPGFDVSWSAFFRTDDRGQVERICSAREVSWRWKPDNVLMLAQRARALARNPRTGDWSFLNQIMLYHPSFFCPEYRDALTAAVGADRMPRNVSYGDGSAIGEEVLRRLQEVYESEAVSFRWQAGDALVVDNTSVAHGRRPFRGSRELLVGLGDPTEMRA